MKLVRLWNRLLRVDVPSLGTLQGSSEHPNGGEVPALCRTIRVDDLSSSLPIQTTPQSTIHKTIKEHTNNWLPTFHSSNNNNPNRKLLNNGLSTLIKIYIFNSQWNDRWQRQREAQKTVHMCAKNHVISKAVRQR